MNRMKTTATLFSVLFFCGAVFSSTAKQSSDAAQETLLWLKEKELFSLVGCRNATKRDVRTEKSTELGDIILRGTVTAKEATQEINISHYVRLRLTETSSDSLGSRLGRMGLSLLDVPTKTCKVWESISGKK